MDNKQRNPNDRDRQIEREDSASENERYDESVRGESRDDADGEPVDPDSPDSENDRDDMVDE